MIGYCKTDMQVTIKEMIITKKDTVKEMCFGIFTNKINFVVFPKTYSKIRDCLKIDVKLEVDGKEGTKNNKVQFIINDCKIL